jgi:DNA primase
MGVVDDIKERLDLVEFISGYMPLKKAGRTFKGLCPFHAEKTPSFVVFPHTQTWHCFGACGTGGDIFSFLMQREGLDFSEALRQLAQRAGIALAPAGASEAADPVRDKLLAMHALAAEYFHQQLTQSASAAGARAYVQRRAIDATSVQRFQLGYAPDTWESLKHYLAERGYTEDNMLAGGLVVGKDGGGSYDRFRRRLMIPIRDRQGRVIGFGARALDAADNPKYLNSPQTPLFDKSSILFGLDLAKQAIREADRVVIVEGYVDVISAHQRGFANVVAGMGTSLTEAQLRQVQRLTRHFVLALDADTAGNAATLRGISLARQALERSSEPVLTSQGLVRFEGRLDVDIRIASLPAGQDPDDILRQTPGLWPQLIDGAPPVVSFYLQTAAASHDLNTAKGKSGLVRQVMPLLREVADPMEQAVYLNQLAQQVKIDLRDLQKELQAPDAARPAGQAAAARPRPATAPLPAAGAETKHAVGSEEYLLVTMLKHPHALAAANAELSTLQFETLSAADFVDTQNRQLFQLFISWVETGLPADPDPARFDQLIQQAQPVLQEQLLRLRQRGERPPFLSPRQAPAELVNRVLNLRHRHWKIESDRLHFLQQEAEQVGDREERNRYVTLATAATERLQLVERTLDSRAIMSRRRHALPRY